MEKEMHGEIVIDAPADLVWEVLGHRFGDIGEWASIMKSSAGFVNEDSSIQIPVSGRVCKAYGFGQVQEDLLEYDEQNMRYRYQAVKGLPGFIKYAENNWSVIPLSSGHSKVACKAVLRMGRLTGVLLFPLFNVVMTKMGERLLSDLKKYIESQVTT